MFSTKTILLKSKKKERYACNLKFEYLLDKNNQRVIKIVPKMEITNKSSTNQKNPVHKPPSNKTTNITTTFRKKKNPLTC